MGFGFGRQSQTLKENLRRAGMKKDELNQHSSPSPGFASLESSCDFSLSSSLSTPNLESASLDRLLKVCRQAKTLEGGTISRICKAQGFQLTFFNE